MQVVTGVASCFKSTRHMAGPLELLITVTTSSTLVADGIAGGPMVY